MSVTIEYRTPDVATYLNLRVIAGLSPKTAEAAQAGLPNSLFAMTLVREGRDIGMGRIVGDGGCNFEIVDIAVHPDFQGNGYGRLIMEEIMAYLNEHAPPGAYVSMVADEPAFYKKFGFDLVRPRSEGMFLKIT